MSRRPVFIPNLKVKQLVEIRYYSFEWANGFAPSQKKKNIISLHSEAKKTGLFPLLEVSSKSEELLGQRLSSFSLQIQTEIGDISVESAFQGSKVFERGGPFTEIYNMSSKDAKRTIYDKNLGNLIGFQLFHDIWPNEPKTMFYDWLYFLALKPHQVFLERLFRYKGFTDIEFNPTKSINCQARSCALLVSLIKLKKLDEVMESKEVFTNFYKGISNSNNLQVGIEEF